MKQKFSLTKDLKAMKRTFYLFTILLTSLILASCKKNSPDNPHSAGTLTDICGNTYNYVKIGSQYWMAENMRCNKYDTNSERKGQTISKAVKPASSDIPYYTDASNKNLWLMDQCKDPQITNLEQLGYLYNWAAAAGTTSSSQSINEPRQGICPNGWHIPSKDEWTALINYVTDNSTDSPCNDLKAQTGWWNENTKEQSIGIDKYGFTALPAGWAGGTDIMKLGYRTAFFSTSLSSKFYSHSLRIETDNMWIGSASTSAGNSVRCIKN